MENIKINNVLLYTSRCIDKKTADGIGLEMLVRCLIVEPIDGYMDQDGITEDITLPYYKIIKVCNYEEGSTNLKFGDIILSGVTQVLPAPILVEGHKFYFLYDSQIDAVYQMERSKEDDMSFDEKLTDFDVDYMEYAKGEMSKKEDWDGIGFEPYGDRVLIEALPPRLKKGDVELITPEPVYAVRILKLPKPDGIPAYLSGLKVGDVVFYNGNYIAIDHGIEGNNRIAFGNIGSISGIYHGVSEYMNGSGC